MIFPKILTVCALVLFLQGCATSSFPDREPEKWYPSVSQIELRTIQTRKFNKPVKDVVKTIIEFCKDNDGVLSDRPLSCARKSGFYYRNRYSNQLEMYNYLQEFEISPDINDTKGSSVVRIRLYFTRGNRRADEPQITNKNLYPHEFKELADSLFVNAIELTPQEMR